MKTKTPVSWNRSLSFCLLMAVTAMIFSSCRTTEGFGEDLQKLGNKIENEAERRG